MVRGEWQWRCRDGEGDVEGCLADENSRFERETELGGCGLRFWVMRMR